jgi:hypothetical protein
MESIMKSQDIFLVVGIVVGAIMWGSVTTLIENNGLLAIIGLAFSCITMGVALGMHIVGDDNEAK